MSKILIVLAIVAFAATAAYARPPKGGDVSKHGNKKDHHDGKGHHHGPHPHGGPHGGPPSADMLRFKTLYFVHNTFCYGLPMPNFTKPDANMTRGVPPMLLGKQQVADNNDDSSSSSGSDSDSDSDDSNSVQNNGVMNFQKKTNDDKPKPSAAVLAEEARLSRVVTHAAAAVVLAQVSANGDELCKALVQAEQVWIDYKKANNMSCGPPHHHGKHGGPHGGPHGPHGSQGSQITINVPPTMMNGGNARPPMMVQNASSSIVNARLPIKNNNNNNNGNSNNQQPPARFTANNNNQAQQQNSRPMNSMKWGQKQ